MTAPSCPYQQLPEKRVTCLLCNQPAEPGRSRCADCLRSGAVSFCDAVADGTPAAKPAKRAKPVLPE
jgi:hypothetical protein